MRSSVVATLVFLGLAGLGVRALSMAPRAEPGHRSARSHPAPVVKSLFEVKGIPQSTSSEARRAALLAAQQKLREEVRKRFPDSSYVPTTDYIDRKLVRGIHEDRVGDIDPGRQNVGGTDDMRIVTLQVEFTDELLTEAKAYEQGELARGRMFWLGRLLVLLVLGLGAVAGYIRADEWTRGYYTGRLLVLALGAVAAGAAAVWFLT